MNNFVDYSFLEKVPRVSLIYFFDDVLQKKSLLSHRRPRGTFDNVPLLLEKVSRDIQEVFRNSGHTNGGIQYIFEDNARFYWYRYFFTVLRHLKHTNIARREIIHQIRTWTEEDSHKYDRFDEFDREYQSEKVIWWYTQESFFCRLLNGALRSDNINMIFRWRVYVQDLERNLQGLCRKKVDPEKMYVFRGRRLHINEINKQRDNTDKLIITTCFLSSTANRSVAEMFAGDTASADSLYQPVLYTISTNSSKTNVMGADIRHFSMYPEEEEYLFSLRTIFRIERVEFIDSRWQIDLTAVDEDDPEFCTAISPWKAVIGEQTFFSGRDKPLYTRYLSIENGPFIAFQLLIDLFLRLDQTEIAREEMIEMFRCNYANSSSDLKKLDEFDQTYRHEDAVKWYTMNSFFYRLLARTLRREDIDTLCKLRYYIHDLHNQLARLQTSSTQSSPADNAVSVLYRGQRMDSIDLEKLREHVHELISMNNFLSTTHDVNAAVFFAGDGSLDHPEKEVSVLYQITIDNTVSHSIPFASIQNESIFDNEDEVLFSVASVFRIDTVEQYGKLWVVDLTLINKEDEVWNVLTGHFND